MENDEILFIKMNTGTYGKENINHEVINTVRADNGNIYVYIPPTGNVDKKHFNRDQTKTFIKYIVFISKMQNDECELLAVAKGINTLYKLEDKPYDESSYKRFVNRYIKGDGECNIQYNQKFLNELFPKEVECPLYNFKVDELFKPKEKIKIFYQKSKSRNKRTGIPIHIKIQHHLAYLYESELKIDKKYSKIKKKLINDYNNFINLFNNNDLWCKYNLVDPKKLKMSTNSFLSIIDKESEEQVFTNMLCSFFKLSRGKAFAKFLGVKGNFFVNKEHVLKVGSRRGRADILAINSNNTAAYIIENKIDSSLNGIIKKSKIIESQLNIYYDWLKEKYPNIKNHKILIFVPHKHKNKIENELRGYKNVSYEIYTYSKLLSIFKKVEFKKMAKKDSLWRNYYSELLSALEIQTKSQENIDNERFARELFK